MNPTGKKFVSLFLVFTLMMLSVNLYAKERRGAKLIITKKDGQQVEGELITVKPNSLLLLNTDGKDVSVDIGEIKIIKVVKKSEIGKGALWGLIIGTGLGALVGGIGGSGNEDYGFFGGAAFITMFSAPGGALIGVFAASAVGTDKKIYIDGMADSEIQETLDYLRKKARVRYYK